MVRLFAGDDVARRCLREIANAAAPQAGRPRGPAAVCARQGGRSRESADAASECVPSSRALACVTEWTPATDAAKIIFARARARYCRLHELLV